MEITVYIDVLFLTNFIFDYFLLWLTDKLLRSHTSFWRLILAAAFGGTYAVLAFCLPTTILFSLFYKLLAGGLMATLALRPGSLHSLLQSVSVFYLVTTALGGSIFWIFYFSGVGAKFGAVLQSGSLYVNLPIYRVLLVALALFPITKAAFSLGRKISGRSRGILTLLIIYQGKKLHLKGFYDSGNLLQDEITGKSVIVAEWSRAKQLFSGCKKPEDVKGLTPIPFHTLANDGLLYAFLPDAIYIEKNHKRIQTETVYIGLIDRTLDSYHNWDAILPHNFEGEIQHETELTPKTFDLV